MSISQDTFNKLITLMLLLYTMIMFSLSWYTGKALDLNAFLILVAPLITHTTHLISNKFSDKQGTAHQAQESPASSGTSG
jgi:hypothetical protein